MKKQLIRLTENDLHKIIKESVNRIIMESGFDEFIEKELKLPYEARFSKMTDDDILGMLNKHKKEQMDYDADQLRHQQENDEIVPDTLGNQNVFDDSGKFSNSASYVRGDYKDLPIK